MLPPCGSTTMVYVPLGGVEGSVTVRLKFAKIDVADPNTVDPSVLRTLTASVAYELFAMCRVTC